MYLILATTTLLLMGRSTHAQVVDVLCRPEVCADWLSKYECFPLDEDCIKNGRIFKYPVECGCCDYCISYLDAGEYCVKGQPGQPTAGAVCGAGLGCDLAAGEDHATCKRLNTKCHSAQDQYDADKEEGILGHLRQRPSCDEYGDFTAAVCIPGSICYCVNKQGQRIFGEQAFTSADLPLTMDCKCSRDAWLSSQLMLGQDASYIHCLSNGSYDPLQCVDNICTCVDNDGVPDTSRVHVSKLNLTVPSCFDADSGHVAGRWQRECEVRRGDLLGLRRHLAQDGATIVLSELPACGLDGRYDRKQVSNDKLVCTDAQGSVITAGDTKFEVASTSVQAIGMNCNCARTRATLQQTNEGSGLSPNLPECCPNGNFPAWQCSRGLCYCVDDNGNQILQEVAEQNLEQLTCHQDRPHPCAPLVPHH